MTLATTPAFGLFVRDDHDRVVRALDVQPLHLRADVAQLDAPPIHPNVAVLADRDQQVAGVAIARPSRASGLKTVMPASLMNDVVMMKKISRLIVKSSIGARSMPVSSRFWCVASRLHG